MPLVSPSLIFRKQTQNLLSSSCTSLSIALPPSSFDQQSQRNQVSTLSTLSDLPYIKYYYYYLIPLSLPSSSPLLLPPLSPLLAADTPAKAFKAIAHIVKTVHDLWLPADKHNRNLILASYMQYVFTAPQSQYSSGSFDARTATLMKSQRRPGSVGEDDHSAYAHALRKGGSLRTARTKEIHFSGE